MPKRIHVIKGWVLWDEEDLSFRHFEERRGNIGRPSFPWLKVARAEIRIQRVKTRRKSR